MKKFILLACIACSMLCACSKYEAHEAEINPLVAEALSLESGKCMQTAENEWALPDGSSVVSSTPYDESIKGFAGPTHIFMVLDANSRITTIVPDRNAESGEYFSRLKEQNLFDSWTGLTPAEAAAKQVDAVSGATYSSRSIIATVKATAEALAH